ncbi:MAG TPA: DUF374 domain-containing protein [bacterium]
MKMLRVEYVFHPEFFSRRTGQFLYGFWHGRQFLLVPSYGHGYKVTLMADLSWAGEIQARILTAFGYTVVRGSSKRKGMQVLLDMKQRLEEGKSGAFALDGPTGPIYRSKPGMLFLAKKMRLPIVPLTATAKNAWILKKTWCRYMIPKPFTKCLCIVGEPIFDIDALTDSALDAVMTDFMRNADRQVGRDDPVVSEYDGKPDSWTAGGDGAEATMPDPESAKPA